MSRTDGFAVADIDTGILRDPKLKRLSRLHPDLLIVATLGYIGILTESWGRGERLTAMDGWPDLIVWTPAAVAALVEVELLDEFERIPEDAWILWFGAAADRREKRRQAGFAGGTAKASNARGALDQPSSNALPVPSVLSVPSELTKRENLRERKSADEAQERFDGGSDALESLLASWSVFGAAPLSPKFKVRLDAMVDTHGEMAVRTIFERYHSQNLRQVSQYVLGAGNELDKIPKEAPTVKPEWVAQQERGEDWLSKERARRKAMDAGESSPIPKPEWPVVSVGKRRSIDASR